MNALRMAQYQRQFDSCCGRAPKKAKPLTGIERERLEAQDEQQDATQMWRELTTIREVSGGKG
jgi:hypothetical protein